MLMHHRGRTRAGLEGLHLADEERLVHAGQHCSAADAVAVGAMAGRAGGGQVACVVFVDFGMRPVIGSIKPTAQAIKDSCCLIIFIVPPCWKKSLLQKHQP